MSDKKPNIDVILNKNLSTDYDLRYIIVDKDTGEILDDALMNLLEKSQIFDLSIFRQVHFGYGYKSKRNAYSAFAYKNRDRSKDAEKAQKKKAVKEWCKTHRAFVNNLEQIAFEIAKGSWGPEDKFDAKLVKEAFEEAEYTDLPFTIGEFLKYWGD